MGIERDFIFDPSLVLYLPLYELDGASFMSKDRHGHLCTVTGALWRPDGRWFDGVNDKITVPNHTIFDILTGLTLEAWISKDLTSGNEFFFGKRINGSDDAWLFYVNANKPSFAVWIGGVNNDLTSLNAISATTWYHVCGVYDGVTQKIYVNSIEDASVAQTGSIDVTTDDITIGWGYSDTYAWDGNVGEARIYNRALTPLEIQHNYLATKWRYQ